MSLLASIASLAQPWSDFYNDSGFAQSGVLFLHFGALLIAGGYAIAADRWVLQAGRLDTGGRAVLLDQVTTLHLPVIAGLFVLILTGVAMALADAEALLSAPVFWLKMGCFALLLLNGVTLLRAQRKLQLVPAGDIRFTPAWRSLQWAARVSVSLWLTTLLLGTLLGSTS
jgi:hypothetical protein